LLSTLNTMSATTSKTTIANLALMRVGGSRITSMDDVASKNARICKAAFTSIVAEVIRSGQWNCLKGRTELAQHTTAPAFGWDYSYPLPSDCARIVKVNGTLNDADPGDAFEIEGRSLLTNADIAQVQYIKEDHDTAAWDALLTAAVVCRLAAEIATPIRDDNGDKAHNLMREYRADKLPMAQMKDMAERKPIRRNPAAESRFIQSRISSTNG